MKYLITTLQFAESDFYRRVADELHERGHETAHAVFSSRSAQDLERRGHRVYLLPELMREVGMGQGVDREVERIEGSYPTPTFRDIYVADPLCRFRPEGWCLERTVRHVRALERIFDEWEPDAVMPEVGVETVRMAAYLVGVGRGATVLFPFYTIFPNSLRFGIDAYYQQIVQVDDVRPLTSEERDEVERFIADFTARAQPILPHRKAKLSPSKLRDFARHIAVRTVHERDNEYLRPTRFPLAYARQKARALGASRLYSNLESERPFVYFPLHVTEDFKIKRVSPHCVNQEYLIQQVAEALPQGYDLVLKEHPVSIGRNSVGMLRRLTRFPNVRLVSPWFSTHELIQRSAAVAVISSTVGIEALLYAKPVLTLGQPYWSGYGVTLDVGHFREIRFAVPELLRFQPDKERILEFLGACMRATYPGKAIAADPSDENARAIASSLDAVMRERSADPVPVG
jgi:Capsule polysaccharide biosynthesis protein